MELVFFQKIIYKYPWKSNLSIKIPTRYLQGKFGIDWRWLFAQVQLGGAAPLYVIAGWHQPTMMLLLTYLAVKGQPYFLWSDTPRTHREPSLRNWLRAKWLEFIFQRVCKFLVTGKPGVLAAKEIGVSPDKIVNFPFATNIDYFRPSSMPTAAIHFISSGRLDLAHKGYETALRALALCKKRISNFTFTYAIAGTGPDEEVIRRLICELKLEKEVILLGWLEPNDLLQFYQSGTALLHPSNFDPFPNAVLEAMACGLPVIGSQSAGSAADRITPGQNGYLHQPGDSADLADQILLFLKLSPGQRIEFGRKARMVAEEWSILYHKKTFVENALSCAKP